MSALQVIIFVGLVLFLLGVLTGNGLLTVAQQERERQQADVQRRINERSRGGGGFDR